MKKILFSISAIAMSTAVYSQTPVPAGAISGIWNLAGSPYLIEGLTFVPDDSTLTIEAGVTVEWQGSYTMYIQGQILAIGTADDSILFTAADPETGFKSIRFIETDPANDTSRFEHCIFEYGNSYGAYPDNDGGAIAMIEFDKVVFDQCLFRNNRAVEPQEFPYTSSGGAIALWTSSPKVLNCTFANNVACFGGGIACYDASNPLIENNTFEKNRAIITNPSPGQGYAGAIGAYVNCVPVISKNIFKENFAGNGGGALAFVLECAPMIDHNLFYNDTAQWGGAIELQDKSVGQIINNTIAGNHAILRGGGIDCWTASTAHVENTILWGNTAPQGSQVYLTEVTDVVNVYYSDITDGQGGVGGVGSIGDWVGCIDEDPLFEDPESGNYFLTGDSPCIDTGDPECTDPDGTVCDMGAFYFFLDDTPEIPGNGVRHGEILLECNPNPAEEIVNCQLSIVHGQRVYMSLYDVFGREVRTILDEAKSPGEYTVRMDISDLPAGVFLVRLQAGGQSAVRKLVVR